MQLAELVQTLQIWCKLIPVQKISTPTSESKLEHTMISDCWKCSLQILQNCISCHSPTFVRHATVFAFSCFSKCSYFSSKFTQTARLANYFT